MIERLKRTETIYLPIFQEEILKKHKFSRMEEAERTIDFYEQS